MNEYTKLKAVNSIIGSIDGYGDSNIDEIRYQNICDLEPIIIDWVEKLRYQEHHMKRVEFSLKRQGQKAHEILEEIRFLTEMVGEEQ